MKCELCEENEAIVKCVQCNQFQCEGCQRVHQKIKSVFNHQYMSINEALKEESGKIRVLHCQNHPNQEINTFCKTDETAICPQCVVDFHNGHTLEKLSNISQEFKDNISKHLNKV